MLYLLLILANYQILLYLDSSHECSATLHVSIMELFFLNHVFPTWHYPPVMLWVAPPTVCPYFRFLISFFIARHFSAISSCVLTAVPSYFLVNLQNLVPLHFGFTRSHFKQWRTGRAWSPSPPSNRCCNPLSSFLRWLNTGRQCSIWRCASTTSDGCSRLRLR